MIRILTLTILFFSSISLFAQTVERVPVDGVIQMPEGDDVQGISVFNLNTNRGTTSNNEGEFTLRVAVGDSIQVSAVTFQEFIVVINEGVIESRQLNIMVNEVVNELPEVVVSAYDLTGNVNVDVARLEVVDTPDTLNAADVQGMYFEEDAHPDLQAPVRNEAIAMSQTRLVNGLNFVNIFKEILVRTKTEEVESPYQNVHTDVRELYDDEFFQENLGIELENITEFIYFADENGLEEEMLNEGNELELIDFLVEQSRIFKRQQARNN